MELSQRLTLLRRQSGAPRPRKHLQRSTSQTLSKSACNAYVVRLQEDTPPSRRARCRPPPGGARGRGLIVIDRRMPLSHQHGKGPLTSITTLHHPRPR